MALTNPQKARIKTIYYETRRGQGRSDQAMLEELANLLLDNPSQAQASALAGFVQNRKTQSETEEANLDATRNTNQGRLDAEQTELTAIIEELT